MDGEIVSAQELFDVLKDLVAAIDKFGDHNSDDFVSMIAYGEALKVAKNTLRRFNKEV